MSHSKELYTSCKFAGEHQTYSTCCLHVDDTLLFMEAKKDQATMIRSILRRYHSGAGQLINLSKCSMVFGSGCSLSDQVSVQEILNLRKVTLEEKYLGLPTSEGRMCKNHFKSTKERLVKRFTSRAEKYMSGGAKEVLIKSMVQAILTYVMGVFKLPVTLCDELTQMIRYFLWGEESGQQKVHWLAWEKLLMPKCLGRL
jgi:hypothetical protein